MTEVILMYHLHINEIIMYKWNNFKFNFHLSRSEICINELISHNYINGKNNSSGLIRSENDKSDMFLTDQSYACSDFYKSVKVFIPTLVNENSIAKWNTWLLRLQKKKTHTHTHTEHIHCCSKQWFANWINFSPQLHSR